jgi:hypothetical protein
MRCGVLPGPCTSGRDVINYQRGRQANIRI